ncbi:MAG TPA: hypothetical protein VN660_14325 [Steroidobacteraceae bacterium]|nr:hypothetical protein [Steroidobacteraceae bacterium]
MSALELLPRLLQVLLRHLFAYGELAYEEGVLAARRLRRRLLGAAIACVAGMLALMMGCVWVIAATWDGPNRMLAVGALCVGFVLVTIIGITYAAGGGGRVPFDALRAEWHRDLQEIARLDPTLVGTPPRPAMGGTGGGHE